MRWMLVERRPDTVLTQGQETFLAVEDGMTSDAEQAQKFETRQAAENHRRKLKHPYNWVAVSTD